MMAEVFFSERLKKDLSMRLNDEMKVIFKKSMLCSCKRFSSIRGHGFGEITKVSTSRSKGYYKRSIGYQTGMQADKASILPA